MFAKMTSMAHTPEDLKHEMAEMSAPSVAPSEYKGPKYPYGLCISLDDDSLEKLGMAGDLPPVGSIINFMAIAKVTSASENEREGMDGKAEKCCRVELQITDMGVAGASDADRAVEASEARRERFYGKPAADAAE